MSEWVSTENGERRKTTPSESSSLLYLSISQRQRIIVVGCSPVVVVVVIKPGWRNGGALLTDFVKKDETQRRISILTLLLTKIDWRKRGAAKWRFERAEQRTTRRRPLRSRRWDGQKRINGRYFCLYIPHNVNFNACLFVCNPAGMSLVHTAVIKK